jgi:Protein of unknown function (DUF1488)
MAVKFPNESRSYDATRSAVRFWSHDSAMEASFFVSEDALQRLEPDMCSDEASFLRAFDANRALICATAARFISAGARALQYRHDGFLTCTTLDR